MEIISKKTVKPLPTYKKMNIAIKEWSKCGYRIKDFVDTLQASYFGEKGVINFLNHQSHKIYKWDHFMSMMTACHELAFIPYFRALPRVFIPQTYEAITVASMVLKNIIDDELYLEYCKEFNIQPNEIHQDKLKQFKELILKHYNEYVIDNEEYLDSLKSKGD